MHDPFEVDQKPLDDSELIALFDQTKKEIEAHGELDELYTGNNMPNKKLLTRCLDAIDVMNFKMIQLRERLHSWLKPVKAHFWREQDGRTRLGRRADKSRKLRTRENDLRKLLANSPGAVVVTSTNRRFVAANPKGLSLFGISETNMTMFTLDVFLPCGQLPRFDENGTPFSNRKERHGECEIRRLDGSLRVAEFVFVANFVPFLHVFRFQNDRKWTPGTRLAA